MAILLALASPELDLVGVTTVAGTQTLDKTTRHALVTLEVGGRSDIPVAAGADAPLCRELRTAAHVHGFRRFGGGIKCSRGHPLAKGFE